jgi:tetratricopeptide (TPR) repeat protein/tRNA A-37 threonylcarbamoyl transferase component Bud32
MYMDNGLDATAADVGCAPTVDSDRAAAGDEASNIADSDTVAADTNRDDSARSPRELPPLEVSEPGRYTLHEEIARGGMGRIVAARDHKLCRDIAIKEMQSQTPSWERRFLREMMITAGLQHPSIIALHDAGRWPSGEVFYAMKHVKGRSLAEAVGAKASLDDRLSLLPSVIAVAEAIAYAHSVGVIHRDLKPANVLVGDFGETVVIDWGLAKYVDEAEHHLDEDSDGGGSDSLTVAGEAVGTPAYMSPAQAQGQTVDEQADVYALGALLYHVIVGRSPYADKGSKSVDDLMRRVKAGPPTPITELHPDAPRDLLAIVDKAMARTASQRYASAAELAEDLNRFAAGQRVRAHDYSSWHLVARWLGRHRAAVGVAAVMAAALAVSTGVSFMRITDERDRAEAQQRLAEEHRGEAEGLMGFMLGDMHTALRPLGKTSILGPVALETVEYFERRPVDWSRPDDVDLRAAAYVHLGEVRRAEGDSDGALESYATAMALRKRLVKMDGDDAERQRGLSRARTRISAVYRDRGELDRALVELREDQRAWQRLVELDPSSDDHRSYLARTGYEIGEILEGKGQHDDALAEYRDSHAIRQRLVAATPEHPERLHDVSVTHDALGALLIGRKDLVGALAEYTASVTIAQQLVDLDSENARWRRALFVSRERVGDVYRARGDLDRALDEYGASRAAAAWLVERDPQNAHWQRDLSVAHGKVGNILLGRGDLDDALASYVRSKQIRVRLVAIDPNNSAWARDLSVSHGKVGTILRKQGKLAEALVEYSAGLAIREGLVKTHPENTTWQHDIAVSHYFIGEIAEDLGDTALAHHHYGVAVDIAERLVREHPQDESLGRFLEPFREGRARTSGR